MAQHRKGICQDFLKPLGGHLPGQKKTLDLFTTVFTQKIHLRLRLHSLGGYLQLQGMRKSNYGE